ncbi:MAG: DUF3291 domain-containing protein [Candidatus Latescibacteria bacterium]|nr:DUF3291 domain-containing protein [Candidatus Latescibacterota bacterium]
MGRIAFYTFGILRQPYGHQDVQGFFDRVEAVFEQADQAGGFIARNDGTWGTYVLPRFFVERKHASAQATLSVWRDIESICAFAYRGAHGEAVKKRSDWAIKPAWPTYVAWWVADDHYPTHEEACQRHEYLHDHGPSPCAFNFKQPFDREGQPVELDRQLLQERMTSNQTHQTEDS